MRGPRSAFRFVRRRRPIRSTSSPYSFCAPSCRRISRTGLLRGRSRIAHDIKMDLAGLDLTPEKFLGPIGLRIPAGEQSRMVIEQISTRPTAEVNGIIGGYTGEGAKTVIPGKAMANVSFRLVGAQDPEKIRNAFREFVRGGCRETARLNSAISRARRPSMCRLTIQRSTRRATRWRWNGQKRR